MQVARTLLRSPSFSAFLRSSSHTSRSHEETTDHQIFNLLGIHLCSRRIGTSPRAYQCFMPTYSCRDLSLRSLEHLQLASRSLGIVKRSGALLGVTLATSYIARWHGVAHCEKDERFERDQQAQVAGYSASQEDSNEFLKQHSQILEYLRRLWWPAIFVCTVFVGYPYPATLIVNCVLMLWSTKPSPASIYLWIEERRKRLSAKRRISDKMNDKVSRISFPYNYTFQSILSWCAFLSTGGQCVLNPESWSASQALDPVVHSATVIHVEVRDFMLFCLARVTSLTQNSIMVGLLGDWWVVYTSSSTITTLGLSIKRLTNLDELAKELRYKKAELEAEGRRVAEDGIKKFKSWC